MRWRVNVAVIDRERVRRGFTQTGLAASARVDPKTVGDMLIGRRRPTFGTLQAVCAALDLTLAEVVVFDADGVA